MRTVLNILFILSLFSSCKEELTTREETEKYCWENMEFTCSEPMGEFYFRGKINDRTFCVSIDVDEYRMSNGVWTETFTSTENPTLPPDATPQSSLFGFSFYPPIKNNYNGITEDFAPRINLYTPSILDTSIVPAKEFFDRFIEKGDLVWRDDDIDKYNGFYFWISWSCVFLPGYHYYAKKGEYALIPVEGVALTPSTGKQEDAVFRISEYEKTVLPDFIIYDLTFEIECNLYHAGTADRRYYGRLEDGEFKTQVMLPRG